MTAPHPIPPAALSQHIAILGKTGSGKSYAARGIVENLLDAGGRVCVIDPTGAWHGLRSSVDGKKAGYPVAIFGGNHGDFPLAAQHGEELAEIIGTSSTPAILDVSLMRTGERTRFFTGFAEELLRKNKGPLHLIIDEAHLFAPQGRVSDPQSGAMLHAANNMVSLGRSRGLRIILITQRPAKLHKDSLTQVETLVAMRLIAPQDRKAVEEWIKDNADGDQGRQVLSSLAALKTGQAWIWAPELGILERVHFPRIKTFDSGRAPDGAADGAGPVLAPIDRQAIGERLKAVAQEAIDNDPKRLRARIAELERQAKGASPAASREETDAAERRGFDKGYLAASAAIAGAVAGVGKTADEFMRQLRNVSQSIEAARPENPNAVSERTARTASESPRKPDSALAVPRARQIDGRAAATGDLGAAARKILTVLAQFPEGCAAGKLALLTGYSYSGGFRNALSELRTAGYLAGGNTERMRITDAGLRQGPFDPLPSGRELLRYWLAHPAFGQAARKILEQLADHPSGLTADQLVRLTGYEYSGGFRNALSELRTAGVLTGRNSEVMHISEELR